MSGPSERVSSRRSTVDALAVADGVVERERVLGQLQQLADARDRVAGGGGDLLVGGLAVQLLGEFAAGALHAAHLVGDVHGESDRASLVDERAHHGLPDPPRCVRREPVAHRPVELLDGADQAEVALLDQVEERHLRLRVVPRDRHHEAEVRLDQLLLGRQVARVLAPRQLPLPRRREQRTVADLAHVELERVRGDDPLVGLDRMALLILGGIDRCPDQR